MQVPLLSTALVGTSSGGQKMIGPGHASFVPDPVDPDLFHVVFHASIGHNCNRYAFIEEMRFNAAGWPYINFQRSDAPASAPLFPYNPNATVARRRLVVPCNRLASDQLPLWDIPACVAGSSCEGLARDGSGAVCAL